MSAPAWEPRPERSRLGAVAALAAELQGLDSSCPLSFPETDNCPAPLMVPRGALQQLVWFNRLLPTFPSTEEFDSELAPRAHSHPHSFPIRSAKAGCPGVVQGCGAETQPNSVGLARF